MVVHAELQNDSLLVSAPATTHPLSADASYLSPCSRSSNEHTDAGPSHEQATAIDDLKAFNEFSIITWLTLLRSIDPSIYLRAGHPTPGCLTSQQLRALVTLRGCHNDHVSSWLELALLSDNASHQRASYASKRSNARRPTLSSPRHTRQNSAKSSNRSSTNSIGPCSTNNSFTSRSTPRSSLGNGSVLFDLPEDAPEDEESTHAHYCTHSEHPKSIGTCDAWKRHEREHEVVYRCMPFGAVENKGSGPECAFCGMRDPDPSHRLKHNAIACPGATRKPLTLSRRSNLVKHLTLHNIFGEEASTLADKWRYDSGKKAFSCGFCIKYFPTLSDRSSHIDNEHWKNGQDMSGWSLTNVIKGLLLQPELKDLWQNRVASNSWLQESSFRREPARAEGLQSKLELGEDSPIELIDVAYGLSNYGSELGPQGVVAATPIPAMLPLSPEASSHPMVSAHVPAKIHTQNAAPEMRQRKPQVPRGQPFPPWSDNNTVRVDSVDWSLGQPYQQSVSHWNAVSNDTGPFCTESDEILQWCSSLDAPPTPSNQNLQLNFDLYNQGCANTSTTISSRQQSSEKPLPPLPDCNQANSPFEAGIGSFMDIDSEQCDKCLA